MPRSEKALAALAKTKSDPRIKPQTLHGPMSTIRAAIRDATLAATELQFDLADVDDMDDRRHGIEEASQKVGGYLRELAKLREQCAVVCRIAEEIERETPRIEAQLGGE